MFKYLIALVFVLPVFSPTLGVANTKEPQQIVEEIFQKAANKKIFLNMQAQEEINQYIDFPEMAKNVLGALQNSQKAEEIAWFEKTLKEIITRTVYPEAPKFLQAVKISYKGVKKLNPMEQEKVKVSSLVKSKGEITEVEYVFRKLENSWRVVDISIDGESWTQSIASEVQKTVQKKQWSGLKDRLNKRLASLRAGKKNKVRDENDV